MLSERRRTGAIALMAVAVLVVSGCSRGEKETLAGPVAVAHKATPPSKPVDQQPPPPQQKPAPAISRDEAFERAKRTGEVALERAGLGSRFVMVMMQDDDQFYHVSVGEDQPSKIRFSLHLKVNKADGSVYFWDGMNPDYRKATPLPSTREEAIKEVLALRPVQAARARSGESFVLEVVHEDNDGWKVYVGERRQGKTVWTERYHVSKEYGWVWTEEVSWPPETFAGPVTAEAARALVERLEPVQEVKRKVGSAFTMDVNEKDPETWLVLVGSYREGIGFSWQGVYYVNKADGTVSRLRPIETGP